jgi:hypothetical protein
MKVVIHSPEIEVVRLLPEDPGADCWYTVSLPNPVKPENLLLIADYLPEWAELESTEWRDTHWYFHFTVAAP